MEVVPNVFRAASGQGAAAVDAAAPAPPVQKLHTKDGSKKPAYMKWSKSKVLYMLRLINCCNGACLITVAIISFLLPIATL